ncbi:hypothetical protein DPMN_110284 [Dreissena polymorpha]|uniref:Uncharacterized protein n=1 Tax=Dreissena polymorpha TaxID=45954 RepID=A0A9D4QMW7_DREPO|nr:hypothetical protein DPMN_110284 [Dreissena polymorpha]
MGLVASVAPRLPTYMRSLVRRQTVRYRVTNDFESSLPYNVRRTTLINILTKFHKDWMKTMNILISFHKDWMKTVTSTVYTNKLLTDERTHARTHAHTPDITRSHKLTMSLCDR